MAEVDLDELVSRTAEQLGNIIKKPPMQKDYLKRPPFKFIRDIIKNVIRSTGFLEGLFTSEELKSDGAGKEEKIAFLQKAITATSMATDQPLEVKPRKVAAGKDSHLTNIWLQTLAQAAASQIDSTDAVNAVLRGETTLGGDSSGRNRRDRTSSSNRGRSGRERGSHHEEDRARNERPHEAGSRKEARLSHEDEAKTGEQVGDVAAEPRKERPSSARGKRPAHAAPPSQDQDQDETDNNTNAARKQSASDKRNKRNSNNNDNINNDDDYHSNNNNNHPTTATTQDSPPPQQEESKALPPSFRQPIERPSTATARAAPPRTRKIIEEDVGGGSRGSSANEPKPQVAIIGENGDDEADDDDGADDMFVVISDDAPRTTPLGQSGGDGNDEDHGALMRKIQEKKEEVQREASDTAASSANDAIRQRDRELAEKEIAQLRADIQELCRSANPLGKIVDYIQEDVDSMMKEMQSWKEERDGHVIALQEEESVTSAELAPLRLKLTELDQQISDQEELIAAAKATVWNNDEKIRKILESVAFSAKS